MTQLTYWPISDRLDSITPLGRDSVPDVYISRSGSSSATRRRGRPGRDADQSSTSCQPSAGAASAADAAARPSRPAGRPAPSRRSRQRVLDDDAGRAGVVEDERDLLCGQHEVDRHQHHAEPGGREHDDGELPAVVRQQRQPVALGQAAFGEGVRAPVDCRVELGEGQPPLAVDDRELVRVAAARCAAAGHRSRAAGPGRQRRRQWTASSTPSYAERRPAQGGSPCVSATASRASGRCVTRT